MTRRVPLPVVVALVLMALVQPMRLTFAAPSGPIVLAPGESVTVIAQEVSPSIPTSSLPLTSPSVSPSKTVAPSPESPAPPTESPGPSPIPTPSSVPSSTPSAPNVLGIDLSALPTTGPAWTSMKAWADGTWAAPDLSNQDNKADVRALAAALVYARTADPAYRAKVTGALDSLRGWSGRYDSLALFRQLGGWALAADLVDDRRAVTLAYFRAALDFPGDHSRWHTIRTAPEAGSATNYNGWANVSRIAIARYLRDDALLATSWTWFVGLGEPYHFTSYRTTAWQQAFSCLPAQGPGLPIAINPAGCGWISGAPVEDASRSTFPTVNAGYVTEFLSSLTESAVLLDAAGLPAWSVNDAQVCRAAAFLDANGGVNYHPVFYFGAHVLNAECGTSYAERTPDWGGRQFGGASWLWP